MQPRVLFALLLLASPLVEAMSTPKLVHFDAGSWDDLYTPRTVVGAAAGGPMSLPLLVAGQTNADLSSPLFLVGGPTEAIDLLGMKKKNKSPHLLDEKQLHALSGPADVVLLIDRAVPPHPLPPPLTPLSLL